MSDNETSSVKFDDFYIGGVELIFPIAASVLNLIAVTPMYYAIIWFEKYGTDHRRSLLNKLVASTCWNAIVYNLTAVPMEIILTLFGPFGKGFCTFQVNKDFHKLLFSLGTNYSSMDHFRVIVKANFQN